MGIDARLTEIANRKKEIRSIITTDKKADLDALEKELRELEIEKDDLEKRKALLVAADEIQDNTNNEEVRSLGTIEEIVKPEEKENKINKEKRGKDLKESRSITVGTSNFITAQHQASDINKTFNEVSSLIDNVTHKPLKGGESYQRPYIVGTGEGDYTTQSAAYADVETKFDYADIKKTKITAYSEEPEEIQKLAYADYDTEIVNGVSVALRKKITKQILIGDGATNHIVGIFSKVATAIDSKTDLELTVINEDTLTQIVYSYGGDEDVEGTAVLILNKLDLAEFAKLKSKDGKKIHNIVNKGNSGTIDGIPFIINSACKSITKGVAGDYCMAYGNLSNYELAIFSDMDVQRSTDYKFKEGQIAHKGVIFVGGNVTSKNGFLRVKKKA